MAEEMRCARHPSETTYLTCSRCGTPVCVRCMRYTPVGIRCRSCAAQPRSGVFAPSLASITRAAGAAILVAAVTGVVWGEWPAFGFWFSLILGFGGGELVSLASGRRRGPELQAIAAGMVVLAFAVAYFLSNALGHNLSAHVLAATIFAGLAMVLAVMRQG